MESSHKTRKITGQLLLGLLLALTAWAACAQFSSPDAQILAANDKGPVEITVLTSPAMFVSYNPAAQKASVRVLREKRNQKNPAERARKILEGENLAPKRIKFFEPVQTDREQFWDGFKHALASWRYNPSIILQALWSYVTAWHERRTNLTPAEFLLLSTELSQLEANDFTVKLPPRQTKRRAVKESPAAPAVDDMAPLVVKDRPIVVEILNASGQRGLALELTQYLREQNQKGQLRVDVLQYDNYPSLQETSWLEDYSGRLMQVKQLSQAIGVNGEIKAGSAPNVICDTRIILGKDFHMPL